MITWHDLLKEGKERLYQAGNSEQAAMLLLNELCRHQNINLYTCIWMMKLPVRL